MAQLHDFSSLKDVFQTHIFGCFLTDDAAALLACRAVCRLWEEVIIIKKIKYRVRALSLADLTVLERFALKSRAVTLIITDSTPLQGKIVAKMTSDSILLTLKCGSMSLRFAPLAITPEMQNWSLERLKIKFERNLKSSNSTFRPILHHMTEKSLSLRTLGLPFDFDSQNQSTLEGKNPFPADLSISRLINSFAPAFNTTATSLKITHEKLSSSDLNSIIEFIDSAQMLRSLDLSCAQLTDVDVCVLTCSGGNFSNLLHLNLSGNDVSYVGGIQIASHIEENPPLLSLELEYACLDDDATTLILSSLLKNTTLTALNLGGDVGLRDFSIDDLCSVVRSNTTLVSLKLFNLGIFSSGASRLADALMHNTTLQHLDLRHNYIDDNVATKLASLSQTNPNLQCLNLKGNISFTQYDEIKEIDTRNLVQLTYFTSDDEDDWSLPEKPW